MHTVTGWIVGLLVSLLVGHFVTIWTLSALRRTFTYNPPSHAVISPWITGAVERLFFTVAVAFDFSAVTVAMIAWIAAKMLPHWNTKQQVDNIEAIGFSALNAGLVSMLFAMVGGLICRGTIALPRVP